MKKIIKLLVLCLLATIPAAKSMYIPDPDEYELFEEDTSPSRESRYIPDEWSFPKRNKEEKKQNPSNLIQQEEYQRLYEEAESKPSFFSQQSSVGKALQLITAQLKSLQENLLMGPVARYLSKVDGIDSNALRQLIKFHYKFDLAENKSIPFDYRNIDKKIEAIALHALENDGLFGEADKETREKQLKNKIDDIATQIKTYPEISSYEWFKIKTYDYLPFTAGNTLAYNLLVTAGGVVALALGAYAIKKNFIDGKTPEQIKDETIKKNFSKSEELQEENKNLKGKIVQTTSIYNKLQETTSQGPKPFQQDMHKKNIKNLQTIKQSLYKMKNKFKKNKENIQQANAYLNKVVPERTEELKQKGNVKGLEEIAKTAKNHPLFKEVEKDLKSAEIQSNVAEVSSVINKQADDAKQEVTEYEQKLEQKLSISNRDARGILNLNQKEVEALRKEYNDTKTKILQGKEKYTKKESNKLLSMAAKLKVLDSVTPQDRAYYQKMKKKLEGQLYDKQRQVAVIRQPDQPISELPDNYFKLLNEKSQILRNTREMEALTKKLREGQSLLPQIPKEVADKYGKTPDELAQEIAKEKTTKEIQNFKKKLKQLGEKRLKMRTLDEVEKEIKQVREKGEPLKQDPKKDEPGISPIPRTFDEFRKKLEDKPGTSPLKDKPNIKKEEEPQIDIPKVGKINVSEETKSAFRKFKNLGQKLKDIDEDEVISMMFGSKFDMTNKEVDRAIRKLSKKYHPDKFGNRDKVFEVINNAGEYYKTINFKGSTDDEKREARDKLDTLINENYPIIHFLATEKASELGSDFTRKYQEFLEKPTN